MKQLVLLLFLVVATACKNDQSSTKPPVSEASKSAEYKAYVAAYNDYVECVGTRPQLTNDLLNKKIDGAEFEALLDKNTKVCSLKKKLYTTYYEILEVAYPVEAPALRLDPALGQ